MPHAPRGGELKGFVATLDVALGRNNVLFIGFERGGRPTSFADTLTETTKLNGVDPQEWLTDVLGRIADQRISRLDGLRPRRYGRCAYRFRLRSATRCSPDAFR